MFVLAKGLMIQELFVKLKFELITDHNAIVCNMLHYQRDIEKR